MMGIQGLQYPQTIIKDLSKQDIENFQRLESYQKQQIDGNKVVYEFDRRQSVQLSSLLLYSKPIQKQQEQQFVVVLDFQWIQIIENILSHYFKMIQLKFQHNDLKPEYIWIHLNQEFTYLQKKDIKILDITFTNYVFNGEKISDISDIISKIQTTIFNKYNQIDAIKQLKIKQEKDQSQAQDILLKQYEKTYELLKKLKDQKNQKKCQQLINESLENFYDQKVIYKDFYEIFQKCLIIKELQGQITQNEQINQKFKQNYQQYQQEIFDILFKQFTEYGVLNLTIEIKQKRNREIQQIQVFQDLNKSYLDLKRHYSNYLQLNLIEDQFIERIWKYSLDVVDYQGVDHKGMNFQRVKNNYINEQIRAFEQGFITQIIKLF